MAAAPGWLFRAAAEASNHRGSAEASLLSSATYSERTTPSAAATPPAKPVFRSRVSTSTSYRLRMSAVQSLDALSTTRTRCGTVWAASESRQVGSSSAPCHVTTTAVMSAAPSSHSGMDTHSLYSGRHLPLTVKSSSARHPTAPIHDLGLILLGLSTARSQAICSHPSAACHLGAWERPYRVATLGLMSSMPC